MTARAEKSAKTQRQIISVAQEIFARDGYAGAALAEVVSKANVTTGAVYHHFGGKKGLFIAVAENLEQQILDEVVKSAPASAPPWEAFETGVLGVLEICARPDIQRIVFRDAPTVVGQAEWRAIEMKYAYGLMRQSIASLSKEGVVDTTDAGLTAQILLGAVIEAAHAVAHADDPELALAEAKKVVRQLLLALRRK